MYNASIKYYTIFYVYFFSNNSKQNVSQTTNTIINIPKDILPSQGSLQEFDQIIKEYFCKFELLELSGSPTNPKEKALKLLNNQDLPKDILSSTMKLLKIKPELWEDFDKLCSKIGTIPAKDTMTLPEALNFWEIYSNPKKLSQSILFVSKTS